MKKLSLFLIIFLLFAKLHAIDSEKKLKNYFKDILLIINFNSPYYDNIQFLKEIYSPFFKNIVFYGEKDYPEVNVIVHNQGWYVHRAISDAMKKWPNFKGYICCQDDCFMNFWNFTRLDKRKLWLHQYWTASLDKPNHPWPWWSYPCGHAAAVKAYKKLDKKSLRFLEINCGARSFGYTWGDFIYVSARYRKKFIQLSSCFDNPDVFIEIALPTILLSMDQFKNMEHLKPCWGGTINTINLADYRVDFDWIHPIKFSREENRDFIRHIISNMKISGSPK